MKEYRRCKSCDAIIEFSVYKPDKTKCPVCEQDYVLDIDGRMYELVKPSPKFNIISIWKNMAMVDAIITNQEE